MSTKYQERLAQVEKVLLIENKTIDLAELQAGCSYGIPDPLRPLGWRLLLNYLPLERQLWPDFLRLQRANYDALVDQLVVQPGQIASQDDHPLSDSSGSEWNAFFTDNNMLSQIDKDVRRLCPEIQFFQMNTPYPHRSAAEVNLSQRVTSAEIDSQNYEIDKFGIANMKSMRKQASEQYIGSNEASRGQETHWQVVERILFIYAKLNPGVKYVQGMNEILGPLYYVLASDADKEWAKFAEADAFFCFQQLMSEVKDCFIRTLDDSNCGIESMMYSFHNLLSSYDVELYEHMITKLVVKPQFYAFRWLSLLLSQEFSLPDVITIWDSLFSDTNRFSLLPFVCLAMIEHKRDELLKGDFADCVRLLQNYPDTDVSLLVSFAFSIRDGSVQRPLKGDNDTAGNRFARHARQLSDKIKDVKLMWKK